MGPHHSTCALVAVSAPLRQPLAACRAAQMSLHPQSRQLIKLTTHPSNFGVDPEPLKWGAREPLALLWSVYGATTFRHVSREGSF